VVVELLTGPQPQWLQGLSQNSLDGLGKLTKRAPPINDPQCCNEFQGLKEKKKGGGGVIAP